MSRTFIVGDVHGMLPELRALLHAIQPTKADRLVFAGDLVDKGPDSAGVVRLVRSIRDDGYDVVLVKGNHEEKHERFRGVLSTNPAGASKFKNADELRTITEALTPADVAFLDSAVLFHALPEHEALVVHAGILPDMDRIPSAEEIAAMSRGEREKLARVLRVRHVRGRTRVTYTVDITVHDDEDFSENLDRLVFDHDGRLDLSLVRKSIRPKGAFVSLGDEEPGDPFWAEVYDGRFGHVYFGHSPFTDATEPERFAHATGLDLGCVFGGRLAAAVLEPGKPPAFVTVPASGKFATSIWEE